MSRKLFTAAILILVAALAGLAVAQRPTAPSNAEEQALRQSVAAYAAAFNKGDIPGIVANWAPDAEYTDDSGTLYKGRDSIVALFRKALTEQKGVKMTLVLKSVRFIRPDVALGEGTSEMTAPTGAVDKGRFTAAWVKSDGKWVLTSAHDLPTEADAAASPIKEFEWLVGDWQTSDKDSTTTMTCRPILNKAFLQLTFTVKQADGEMSVIQLMGFDPLSGQMKSWTFDSVGGYGEALWGRDGNQWVGMAVGVLPSGDDASSMYVVKFTDDQNFTLQMRDRRVGDQPLADAEVKYVRKAAPR
jgi:uncharacterized protein (TIGR02246 family)